MTRTSVPVPKYRRVMLKLSGEALLGQREYGISPETCNAIAQEIKDVKTLDVQLAIVLGGGNIFRGLAGTKHGLDRTATKYDKLSYMDALKGRLNVMDSTAFSLCMDNKIPIIVFDLAGRGNIKRVILGETIGTLVSE